MVNKQEMKEITVSELKEIQLEILDDIHQFCKEHEITYYLFAGTLIGAVRHQGFIPWDDDVDICMKREDYEKFFKLYPKNRRYQAIDAENTKDYYLSFGKVVDTNTVMYEEVDSKETIGVYVDVFPLDQVPAGKAYQSLNKKLGFYRNVLTIKNLVTNPKRAWYKNLVISIGKTIFKPVSRQKVLAKIKRLATSYQQKDCPYLADIGDWQYNETELCSKAAYDEVIELDFEGKKYCAPKAYDEVLTKMYGDYMTLPPKEQQESHHSFKAFWIEQ